LLVGWFDDSEDRLDSEDRDWILEHPRIVYTGAIADTASYYRAMDLFVLPTHREGFPNVVLEAAASGLAVITTVTTGALDAVIHERTGILIQAKKPEEIVSAVLRMMGDDRQCKEFGETGRRWMQEEFRRERVLGLAVDFYQGLLQDDLSKVRDRERGAAI
jgi:glycosyltransferase involved in cell wall biosynthesis